MKAPSDASPPAASTVDVPSQPDDLVLVVDDEIGVRDLMVRWLRQIGIAAQAVSRADDAIVLFRTTRVAVALCDIRLPGRDGLWLAEQLRRLSPDTAVVMATGVQDVGVAVTSLRHGVIDYLMKPFGRDRLCEAVERGLAWHRAAVAAREEAALGEAEIRQRLQQLGEALKSLCMESRDGLEAVVEMLTLREPAMLTHARSVAARAVATGRQLSLDDQALDHLERAALAHEVEKLALPDSVMHKAGPLTASEQQLVRTASENGFELLSRVPFLDQAAALLRARHERWDGTGYPAGLSGEAIPVGSRVLAVVDGYESMTRPRRHQPALSDSDALRELERCRGSQFDPAVVDAFRRAIGAGARRVADTAPPGGLPLGGDAHARH